MTATDRKLSPSQEDYLEAVLTLVREKRVARVGDIARRLNVGMPAVTAALKALAGRGLVNYEAYQFVTLADHGRELAEEISRRHHTLRRFFADVLGMDSACAEANACRIEHAADGELLDRLEKFTRFISHCPRAGVSWVEAFQTPCSQGADREQCLRCLVRSCDGQR